MRSRMLKFVAAWAISLGLASTAAAQNYEGWLLGATSLRNQSASEWKVNLGIGMQIAPSFWGGADSKIYGLPIVDMEWRGTFFASTQRGIGVNLIGRGQTVSGLRLTFDMGRKPTDHIRLTNTSRVKASPELGWFVVHYTGPWRIEADVRKGLGSGHKGVRINLGAALGGKLSEKNTLILGGTVRYTGTKYNKAYWDLKSSSFTSFGVYGDIIREVGEGGGYVGFNVGMDMLFGPVRKAVYTENSQFRVGLVTGVRF
jgi:outer membrane scaffolding protein for murein synthesis (MipA/OmpV family)